MNRRQRQRTPKEDRVDKLNRALAEMVVLGPQNQGRKRTTKTPEVNAGAKVKIKTEDTEPNLKLEEITPVPSESLSKPIALSLVDLSYALSLVFGGCCR